MNHLAAFVMMFIMGLETNLNVKHQIPEFIHSVYMWFICPFMVLPFMALIYFEHQTKRNRIEMAFFSILGFWFGYLIFP
jgi:hypothetical protein